MNWQRYTEFLLSKIPSAKRASGGKVINCRCMECADSKDPKSAHFYISVPWNNDKPSLYYCHKCGCHGMVTYKTLIAWNIYDPQIAQDLIEYNNTIKNNPYNKKYYGDIKYYIRNTFTTTDEKSEYKRQYICSRVGYNLSFEDLKNLKIVLNLGDLIKENYIKKFTRDHNIISDLDREFIGFLSVDNVFLNMRRTCDEGHVYETIDKRYVNYKIYDKMDTSQRFYTIPTIVNLNMNQRIKLHISEGPFDILSVYLNVRNKEEGIYTCVAGSNYMNVILYFLLDLRLPFLEIHFYPDNDKYGSIERIQYITSQIPDPTIPVYVHKNLMQGEKDFGVPANRIIESVMRIR
jgi:hypothetical protein